VGREVARRAVYTVPLHPHHLPPPHLPHHLQHLAVQQRQFLDVPQHHILIVILLEHGQTFVWLTANAYHLAVRQVGQVIAASQQHAQQGNETQQLMIAHIVVFREVWQMTLVQQQLAMAM
jgi:hypothetical protein